MGRYECSLKTYIEFLNTYKNFQVIKEGEESDLFFYIDKLKDKYRKYESSENPNEVQVAKIIDQIQLIHIKSVYEVFYPEEHCIN